MVDLFSNYHNYNCICGKNSPQGQNLYESILCTKCEARSHQGCYEQFKDLKTFLCLSCRLKLWGPFYSEVEKLIKGVNLYSSNKTDHQIIFNLNSEQIRLIVNKELELVIMCSVLKTSNIYEWPQKNMVITMKNVNTDTIKRFSNRENPTEIDNETVILNYDSRNFIVLDPAHIKSILKPGSKAINIICSEPVRQNSYFFISLMKVINVNELAKGILRSNFPHNDNSKGLYSNKSFEKDSLVIEKQEVPIIDTLSQQLMTIPVRGNNCKHLQCFDLLNYLILNQSLNGQLKWCCPICRGLLMINEIFPDIFLHTTLKKIKVELSKGDKASQSIKSVTFDSDGNYHILFNKPQRLMEEERNLEKMGNFSPIKVKKEKTEFSEPIVIQPLSNTANTFENSLKSLELNVELYVELNNLFKDQFGEKKYRKISEKFKEMNIFHNRKPAYFYKFLEMTGLIDFYENSKQNDKTHIFHDYPQTKRNELADLTVAELCECLYKENISGGIIMISSSWARSCKDIIELVRLIGWKYFPNKHFEVYIEFILAYAYGIFNREFSFTINYGSYKPSIEVVLGFLFKELAKQNEFKEIEYGVLISCFRDCLPDLFFPEYIEINYAAYTYDKLTDFYLILLSELETAENLIEFMQKIFKPPQINDIKQDEFFVAKHFLYFAVTLVKKKNPYLKEEECLKLIKLWDKYDVMTRFILETKLDFMNININSVEPNHLYKKK